MCDQGTVSDVSKVVGAALNKQASEIGWEQGF